MVQANPGKPNRRMSSILLLSALGIVVLLGMLWLPKLLSNLIPYLRERVFNW